MPRKIVPSIKSLKDLQLKSFAALLLSYRVSGTKSFMTAHMIDELRLFFHIPSTTYSNLLEQLENEPLLKELERFSQSHLKDIEKQPLPVRNDIHELLHGFIQFSDKGTYPRRSLPSSSSTICFSTNSDIQSLVSYANTIFGQTVEKSDVRRARTLIDKELEKVDEELKFTQQGYTLPSYE
ncbi:hypothetical protein PCE1_002354 [Barthelona sp. PCE]